MKRLISFSFSILIACSVFSQPDAITEKGYYYSPNGFICADGNIYTADMKTLVRFGYKGNKESSSTYDINIPKEAYLIPSNMLYHPSQCYESDSEGIIEYKVYIPPTVKWIAVNAFMSPFVSFYSYDEIANDIPENKEEMKGTLSVVGRYDLQGRKQPQPKHGINIVKYSDNNTRKEFVK